MQLLLLVEVTRMNEERAKGGVKCFECWMDAEAIEDVEEEEEAEGEAEGEAQGIE